MVVSGNSLSYFKKDDNSSPSLGIIDLPGMRVTIIIAAANKAVSGDSFIFVNNC